MKKIITTSILTALASSSLFAQNVGIGIASPSASAKLEISSTNSGLLIPRVALTATNVAGPVTAPATSLLVYNTASVSDVTPGYYYWTGTAWSRLLNSTAAGWSLLGNAGTVAGTNFIGTTDNVAFVAKTNNVEHFRITGAGAVNIWSGINYAVPNNYMAAGSLTIGNTSTNFGGGSGWTGNTAGLMLETLDNTEISAHDSGVRLASLSYYEGAANRIHIGRDMGWGAISTISLNGNVGVGTTTPGVRLDVNGTIRALDIYGSGGQNLIVGDDTYFSDLDVANRLGLISTSNANVGELKLGNSGTNPVLSGNPGYLYIDQEIRLQNNVNVVKRALSPNMWTDQFDGGTPGIYTGNNESEEGGFWANGNYAMILSPGDNDLVKIVDEDYLDNTGSAYDNNAMRARIDGNGQYFQISDARSKTNIQPIQNSLEKLLSINGYTYQFTLLDSEKAKGQKPITTTGVLAQELEKVLPEAVSNYEGNYMVNYAAMTPLLIEAIQEQQTMIENQQKLIEEQMKMVQELKKEVESLKQK
jgi:trimeric autotransporter adhesin